MLPSKLVFLQAPISQSRPHSSFGIGRGQSESASFLVRHRWRSLSVGRRSHRGRWARPSPVSPRIVVRGSTPSPAVRERGNMSRNGACQRPRRPAGRMARASKRKPKATAGDQEGP
jgi:hypothetical protein